MARRGGREEEDGKGRGGAEHKGHNTVTTGEIRERERKGESEGKRKVRIGEWKEE